MKLALALLLASAAPAGAQKFVLDRDSRSACREAVEKYRQSSSVALLQPLYACLENPDPAIRRLTFDKIVQREIWDDPAFPQEFKKLDAAAAKGQREKDPFVSGVASSMRWWLHNYQTYQEDKARARADHASAEAVVQDARDLRLVFCFAAGAALQLVVFLLPVVGTGSLGYAGFGAIFGLMGFIPGKHERVYLAQQHLGWCVVIAAFCIFSFYKEYILPRVSESILLLNGIVFWYLFATAFQPTRADVVLMSVAALPTVGSLVVAFTVREWGFKVKLACYIWFLILTIAIGLLQIKFGNLAFLIGAPLAGRKPLDLFMTGMGFTYLAASLYYIYNMIPLAEKHETQAHRMQRWRDDAEMMTGRFADYWLSAPEAAIILVVQGGLCLANWKFNFVPPPLLANLSLILMPRLLSKVFRAVGT